MGEARSYTGTMEGTVMKDVGIHQIVGRTVKSIIINEGLPKSPYNQVFLAFTDNTYFEIYGHIGLAGGVDKGGEQAAKQYAEKFNAPTRKVLAFGLSGQITRENALDAARRYHALTTQPDVVPVDDIPFAHKKPENCWYFRLEAIPQETLDGRTRYIAISKETGEVVFDQVCS